MEAIYTTDFNFPNQKSVYHGKVRDVYAIGEDTLVMIATDRISSLYGTRMVPGGTTSFM